MKKFLLLLIIILSGYAFAAEDETQAIVEESQEKTIYEQIIPPANSEIEEKLLKEQSLQEKVGEIGYKLLNANRIQKPVIFTYTTLHKSMLPSDTSITKRQIIYYDEYFKYTSSDDEIAALLAREISKAVRSYDGSWGGAISAAQIKMAPKKYEIFADKRAVDYMVNAGYNPLGLITFIHKAYPQKRYDAVSYTNLTSKRLAIIYEYIFKKYPQFLINNEYINNEVYQNFLLSSVQNRTKLEQKLKSGSNGSPDYE